MCAARQVCWVPGSFELPVVAKAMAKSGKFDAVVCIGVVVSAERFFELCST
jgi:6,7-dimethyl-8-ribityllumazine synthase